MIAFVEGEIVASGTDWLVLRTGPIGVRILMPASSIRELPATGVVRLETSLQVREDSLTLYGFTSTADREVFETLLSVSGVGPKLALTALSVLSGSALQSAVISQDIAALQRIPGIGKKTAQRMIIDLASKFSSSPIENTNSQTGSEAASGMSMEVVQALEQLGYQRVQAETAVREVNGENLDRASLLKAALAWLATGVATR